MPGTAGEVPCAGPGRRRPPRRALLPVDLTRMCLTGIGSRLGFGLALLIGLSLGSFVDRASTAWAAGGSAGPLAPQGPLGSTGFSIEVGEFVSLPDQVVVLVPIYVTNPDPLSTLQASVDYDPAVVTFVGMTLAGTASEPLDPTVTLSPVLPPYTAFQIEYDATPLPAGEQQLAIYLRFGVTAPIPPGGGSGQFVTVIGLTGAEPFPVGVTTSDGQNPPVTTAPGTVTVLYGDAVAVGAGSGSALESTLGEPVRVPVQLWSEAGGAYFMMGLDFVDLFLTEVDTSDSPLDGIPDLEVSVQPTPDGAIVTIAGLAGSSIPPFDGEILCTLEFAPAYPFASPVQIHLAPAFCAMDGLPFANLVDGEANLLDHFVRGDVSFDGTIDVADPVLTLSYTQGEAILICPSAGDFNADGNIDLSDVVGALSLVFTDGPPPPAPFPDPGPDPTGAECL